MSKNVYYSRCCGKYVEKNSDRMDLVNKGLIPLKGHHCSRCKKPVTVYGNFVLEEDKKAYNDEQKKIRKDNGIRGTKVEVLPNGDLYLINKVYKKAELGEPYHHLTERWVVCDWWGKYITTIKIEHKTGALYVENDPFVERLKKAKLACVRLESVAQFMPEETNIDILKNDDRLVGFLKNLGWKFRADGRMV